MRNLLTVLASLAALAATLTLSADVTTPSGAKVHVQVVAKLGRR